MDQTRIGTFIAVLGKEKGLTQKELAEQIGISDKTVSKWETGNGMPDIAYLSPLCEVLDINVNELLQTFGGGGHAAAAGVRKRTNDVEKFRQEILERIVMMRKISGQDK